MKAMKTGMHQVFAGARLETKNALADFHYLFHFLRNQIML
jgi:hypothetical protein